MVTIRISESVVYTEGLGDVEVDLRVPGREWVADGVALLESIVDHFGQTGGSPKAEETFAYGNWLVRFEPTGAGRLSIVEYTADGSRFLAGADLALCYWRDQHALCDRFSAAFQPPRPDQMAAVSVGVVHGDTVQGVRYAAPEHMSGWYFTTPRFDGDVSTLEVEHLHHVTANRPDLARYVALPPGYRFDTTSGHDDAWYGSEVAAADA